MLSCCLKLNVKTHTKNPRTATNEKNERMTKEWKNNAFIKLCGYQDLSKSKKQKGCWVVLLVKFQYLVYY